MPSTLRRSGSGATDVVGSTNYFARFGDNAGRALQQRHFDSLQACLADSGGRIVDTAGDGAFMCFPAVENAVAAVSRLQVGLVALNRTRQPEHHLIVRIGVHFGPALTDGTVVTGESVNLCSRVTGTAAASTIPAASGAASMTLPTC